MSDCVSELNAIENELACAVYAPENGWIRKYTWGISLGCLTCFISNKSNG